MESKDIRSNVTSNVPEELAVIVRYNEDASTSDAIASTVIPVTS